MAEHLKTTVYKPLKGLLYKLNTITSTNDLHTLWPVAPLDHVKKRRLSSMAAIDSTALLGALWPAHLAARPCPPRPSPMAQGVVGLIPRVPPPAQAVGAWCAAGALGHSGAGGGLLQCFNSLRTWMHRRSLGFSKPGESMGKSLPSASRAGRARSRPAAAFAHRSQQGSLHHGRRSRALVFNPGALEARSGCGARTQKVRARRPR